MRIIGTLAALAVLTVSTTAAKAQDDAAPAETDTTVAAEASAEAPPAEEEEEGRPGMDDPMASFGLSARLGMSVQMDRKQTFDGNDLPDQPGQNGLNFIFGLNLGDGHGFGTDLNFDLRRYKRSFGGVDVKFGDLTFEPIFGARFQLIDPLYMFVGAGPRIGFGWNDNALINGAGVAGVRIPIQVNYYFLPMLAAQFEFGFGWDTRIGGQDDLTGDTLLNIDRGWVIDFQLGLRFF